MLDDYSSFYAKHMGTVGNFQQIFVPLRPNFTSLTNNKRFRVYKISFPNTHRISSSTPSSFQHYFNDPSWSVSREECNFKFRSNSIPNLFSFIDVKIYRLEDLYNYSRKKKLDPNRSKFTHSHIQVSEEESKSWRLLISRDGRRKYRWPARLSNASGAR